jgi:hypothetical protein
MVHELTILGLVKSRSGGLLRGWKSCNGISARIYATHAGGDTEHVEHYGAHSLIR